MERTLSPLIIALMVINHYSHTVLPIRLSVWDLYHVILTVTIQSATGSVLIPYQHKQQNNAAEPDS